MPQPSLLHAFQNTKHFSENESRERRKKQNNNNKTTLCFNYTEKKKKAHFSYPVALCFGQECYICQEVVLILENAIDCFCQSVLESARIHMHTNPPKYFFHCAAPVKQQNRFHSGVVQAVIFLASVLSSYQGSRTLSITPKSRGVAH